jgi:DNA-binding CsgD family transcriptional regulator/tetratricopeptide (TPR) repeat protein
MWARLVGRHAERARLDELLGRTRLGEGAIVLLSGEAGVGKTRLAADVAAGSEALVLRGAPIHGGTAPYGPLVAALRSYLHAHPGGLADCGPLRAELALLLPELGDPAPAADRQTLFEALRCALARVAARRHALVVLDDLQWSDEATLEVLSALAEPLRELPLLVIAAYRSDGLPRHHGIRRLRNDLRRAGRLDELALHPLDLEETTDLLTQTLGEPSAQSLARAIHDRTEGIPFFVEELAAALRFSGALQAGRRGLELAGDGDVPLPDTVRDAVLIRASELSDEGRAAAEVAAVAGESFDLELVASLSSDGGLSELLEGGLVREQASGAAGFRHSLTREALYADVPWMRRRALHRALAEALERSGAQGRDVARHWLGARAGERAREALLRAAADSEAVHAYRDAAEAGRRALDLWPDSGDDDRRAQALERYARCSQLAGEPAEAARAWRELVAVRGAAGDARAVAGAQRELAAVQELKGDREAAFAAHRAAAEAYAATGCAAEAAVERLAMANQRRLAARHGEAIELARTARREAHAAGRLDLRIRALGLEGLARAKHGDYEGGLETVRGGLALALEHDLTAVAAELYQRLSVTLYDSADYRRAEEALDTALELCRASPDAGTEVACVTCMAYVLRERGEWSRAAGMCRELIAERTAVFVAEALLGAIHAFEGKLSSARRLLASSLATASRVSHYNMTVDTTSALARVAAAEGDDAEAGERCRAVLARWEDSDDHHYAVGGIRWAAAFFAARGDREGAHACAEVLTRIASGTGHADALAALAHAIAETALLEGDADTAADQLSRAVDLHRGLDMPFERAQIELRAGVALAAAGERELGLERLCDAYRTARKLGARPLAAEAAREVGALGESVVVRLGRRAVADADGSGLSRREREVVRLLAVGRTNREIAQDLFLSPRTVDMHVRNILRKLDCRSRVEAAGRAREMGLVG